jgi:hypothetical protein
MWTSGCHSNGFRGNVHAGTLSSPAASRLNRKPAMTPILFYGVPSGCSFGSIVALEWLRQPYHLCRIDMPGQVQGEDYRRLNPLGETPTLRTAQGELLSESLAILNHLAAKGIAQGWASHRAPPASIASTTGWPISTPASSVPTPALARAGTCRRR